MAFSLKCIQHEDNKSFFPRNPNIGNLSEVREREEFVVNFARTKQYQHSAIPACQRLLNTHFREKQPTSRPAEAEAGAGEGARARAGAGPRTAAGPRAGGGHRAGGGPRAGGGASVGEGAG